MTKRFSLAILLPLGVGKGDWAILLLTGDDAVELYVSCPSALMAPTKLFCKWLVILSLDLWMAFKFTTLCLSLLKVH